MAKKDIKNVLNQKFNLLTAVVCLGSDGRRNVWLFRCDCGAEIKSILTPIVSGRKKSCGCVWKKNLRQVGKERFTKHGMAHTKIYYIWQAMISRCNRKANKGFKNYGGRGITVSKDWLSFKRFYQDMGVHRPTGMTLERIDNDAGYSKENCRWATRKEQGFNKRTNVRYTHLGESLTLSEWAARVGMPRVTLWYRINRSNWSIGDTLTRENLNTKKHPKDKGESNEK